MTSPFSAAEFWKPYEGEAIRGWKALQKALHAIFVAYPKRRFAWRGAVNADWAFNSSLYRREWWRRAAAGSVSPPEEDDFSIVEMQVLAEARSWGLHSAARGRLSGLEFLATLQHYGTPTRLIDISFSPLVGAFFAVEPNATWNDADGRLFAIDVTDKEINEDSEFRKWEDEPEVPWQTRSGVEKWSRRVYVWRPAGFDRRIAAQLGGFLLGGVPVTGGGYRPWPKSPSDSRVRWGIEDVRRATSVALRVHKRDAGQGAPPAEGQALFTMRITPRGKEHIRRALARYGIEHRLIYADPVGFAAHGTPWLPWSPPNQPLAGCPTAAKAKK